MSKAPPHPKTISLADLRSGGCGVIKNLGEGKSSSRLQSMGICLGRKIEVVKKGDPLILKVYGTRIGLSGRLASQILVEQCEGANRCWEVNSKNG